MSTTINLPITDMVKLGVNPGQYPWSSIDREQSLSFLTYTDQFFCKITSLADAYKYKKIESASFKMSLKSGTYAVTSSIVGNRTMALSAWGIKESWDSSTICISNQPETQYKATESVSYGRIASVYNGDDSFSVDSDSISINYTSVQTALRELMTYGFYFSWDVNFTAPTYSDTTYPAFISKGTDLPTLELVLSDNNNTLGINSCSPTSGFRAKYTANTYTWSTKETGFSHTSPTIASSKFRWRADSSSSATEVDCGTSLYYTMPANTVSTDTFQWQAEITDSTGATSTSDWYTISTEEVLSTATIVSPKNTTIDGSDANRFEWIHTISTGTDQTKADLQYSSDSGSTWTSLVTVTGSATYTNIVADTFSAGSYLWRVRTYNTDNNAGSWSDSKPFTVIAKPHVYGLASEQNPKPKVTWQSDSQQAYRVYIDDVFDSGVVFGTAVSYTLPVYLSDGTYTVKVIVQNEYGLWSNEATAPIVVSNTAGTAMTLVAVNGSNGVILTWTSVLSYAYYVVYRDDVPIAKIRTNAYEDLTAIGEHNYFIRGIYASSANYGLSNTVTIDVQVDELMLTDLETGSSMSIELTDSSYAELSISDSIVSTSIRISSADYPVNEISHYKDKYISFTCAFVKGNALATQFRGMLGKLVCIKTPNGTSVVGNLLQQQRSEAYFYERYDCTLTQTNYEEEITL